MPEIFKISWSLEVLEYLIFSGVFLGKNILLIFYILQFGKFPEYAWDTLCNFGVKSLEYSWNIQSSTIWEIVQNMLGIHYITFSVKSLEYAWDIQSSCKILYILLLVDIYAQRISLCFI